MLLFFSFCGHWSTATIYYSYIFLVRFLCAAPFYRIINFEFFNLITQKSNHRAVANRRMSIEAECNEIRRVLTCGCDKTTETTATMMEKRVEEKITCARRVKFAFYLFSFHINVMFKSTRKKRTNIVHTQTHTCAEYLLDMIGVVFLSKDSPNQITNFNVNKNSTQQTSQSSRERKREIE